MAQISFSKMHGLGNDFVVIDAINQDINLKPEQIRLLADRHFGIGCDQLLLVEKSTSAAADFRYRIFNADGGEVEQCGNGARCFARFVYDRGLTKKNEIAVETNSGIIYPRLEKDDMVSVNMGIPHFDPASLPFSYHTQQAHYQLNVEGQEISIGAVSMGNPHAVQLVDNVTTAPVVSLGSAISQHADFPHGVNAGFMQIINRGHIRLRVYERGSAETLACGTGACAAVCIGRSWEKLDATVKVDLPGGQLLVRWPKDGEPVWMTGPATYVFEGKIKL